MLHLQPFKDSSHTSRHKVVMFLQSNIGGREDFPSFFCIIYFINEIFVSPKEEKKKKKKKDLL